MKKRLLVFLAIIAMLTITGCGSRKLKSDKDLDKYLNSTYPGEQFEIVSKEEIEITAGGGGCDNPGQGISYQVKSLDTNIIFTVKDEYHFNSFTCEYSIDNDYLEIAKKKFLDENKNYKVEPFYRCHNCIGIKFEKEKYSSKEEMKNSISIVIEKLKNTYPFKHESIRLNMGISIDSENNINDVVNIDDLDKDTINQLVENLYQ